MYVTFDCKIYHSQIKITIWLVEMLQLFKWFSLPRIIMKTLYFTVDRKQILMCM